MKYAVVMYPMQLTFLGLQFWMGSGMPALENGEDVRMYRERCTRIFAWRMLVGVIFWFAFVR